MQAGPGLGNVISISSLAWQDVLDGADARYSAGIFAHEINHMREGWQAGTVDGEVQSYEVQYQVWKEMKYDFQSPKYGKYANNRMVDALVEAHGIANASDYAQALRASGFRKKYYPDMYDFRLDGLLKALTIFNPVFCQEMDCD